MADLERARYICAYLIMRYKEPNRKLIPLFERIEREMEAMEAMEEEQNLLNRIHKIAKSDKYKISDR